MMKLADMRDLGSRAARRWGSNPHARTIPQISERIAPRCARFGIPTFFVNQYFRDEQNSDLLAKAHCILRC